MNEFALNTFQLILSSIFVFIILSRLIEGSINLFQIQNSRLKSLCRLLPIAKLPLFFIVPFIDLNILSCNSLLKPYIRSLFVDISNLHSIPKHLSLILPECLLIVFSVITTVIFTLCVIRIILAFRQIRFIHRNATVFARPILNSSLNECISSITLLISKDIQSPLAYSFKTIILPAHLANRFSQNEYEAVLAHELEHLRWFDPLTKSLCYILKSLFWWIPIRKQMDKIEADQEQACDASIFRYSLKGADLASAIHKTLKCGKEEFLQGFSYLAKNPTLARIEALILENRASITVLSILGASTTLVAFVIFGFKIC